jgi:hypothetical protein
MAEPVLGTLLFYIITTACAGIVMYLIVQLARATPCKTCTTVTYERFESGPSPDLSSQVRTEIDGLQRDMDRFDDDLNNVCSITEFVEDGYVGNASAPADESEFSFSPDIQKANTEKRKKRAKNLFDSLRKEAGVTIECFEEQDDLRSNLDEFYAIQTSGQYKAIFPKKIESIQNTLAFNAKYLKKGLASMEEALQKPVKEGFWNSGDINQEAATVLSTIQANRKDLAALHTNVQRHLAAVQTIKAKQSSVQSGSDASTEFESMPTTPPNNLYS